MAFTAEKTVYFVRHGQSEGNVGTAFQPLDSPLTEKGEEQAKRVARRVNRLEFETLICSPLTRTRQTCEPIAHATGKEPEYSDLFVERVKPAKITGKEHADPEAQAIWRQWQESLYTPGMRVEDGENFDDLTERADRALEYLAARPEKSIVVVTHGWFLRTMFARVLLGTALTGEAFRSFQTHIETENCGLSVLVYGKGAWNAWIFNDHAHLG